MRIETFEHVAYLHRRLQALEAFGTVTEENERAVKYGINLGPEICAVLLEDFKNFINDNKRKILEEVENL